MIHLTHHLGGAGRARGQVRGECWSFAVEDFGHLLNGLLGQGVGCKLGEIVGGTLKLADIILKQTLECGLNSSFTHSKLWVVIRQKQIFSRVSHIFYSNNMKF